MATVEIRGICEPKFEGVREAFARHFESGEEVGASVAVVQDGRTVVDLVAGFADEKRTRPWTPQTIANVYSTTKGITAIAAHQLAERGKLDLEAPVARYWPEFAAGGKADLPVRQLLTHQAGLPAIRRSLPPGAQYDWAAVTSALAEQEPWWKPGTKHGYHAITYGWLVGEVIRRVSGLSAGEYVRREIAAPLGVDFEIGFGPALDARVADLVQAPPPAPGERNMFMELIQDPESVAAKAFFNPPFELDAVNTRAWRASELPAANGHSNARSLARIYGALARGGTLDGVSLLRPASIERAIVSQAKGPDAILPLSTNVAFGFMLGTDDEPMGPNPRNFGHGGAGGSLGFADPDANIGFGYVMNQMKMGVWLIDPRPKAIYAAVYDAL
jgi:CubicO group peptidase (beta-lactamase class C family)